MVARRAQRPTRRWTGERDGSAFALGVRARLPGIRVSGGGRHTSAGRHHDCPLLARPWHCGARPPRSQENCFRLTRCRPTGPRRAIREEAADARRATCGGPTARDGDENAPRGPGVAALRPRPGPAEPVRAALKSALARRDPSTPRRGFARADAPASRLPGSPTSRLRRFCRPSVSGYDARSCCDFWENGSRPILP